MSLIISFKLVLFCLLGLTLRTSNCQNVDVNENFETLIIFRDLIGSSLSSECTWFLSSLFGENDLFPPLPPRSQINTVPFINPNFPQLFLTQEQLSVYYQNPNNANQLNSFITTCESFNDSSSSVLVFLYNLLRNYPGQQAITTTPAPASQICSNFVGTLTSSFDSK